MSNKDLVLFGDLLKDKEVRVFMDDDAYLDGFIANIFELGYDIWIQIADENNNFCIMKLSDVSSIEYYVLAN